MIDFPTLFPSLVKYIPNWMEKFYPRMAQFARGEGYPCGNKGVFIPRRNKCWTHPKTGQRMRKPLTYQNYQDAKEKSQRSRTEKGRTALANREQGFRDKARERVKGWQNKTPESEVKPTLANEAKMRDTLKKAIADNELNKSLANTAYEKYHQHQNGMKHQAEGLSSRSIASLYKIPHATAVARINGLREAVGLGSSNTVSVNKELGERINDLLNDGKQIKINSSGGSLRDQKKEPSQTTIDADKKWSDFLESKNVTEKGLRKLDPETRKKITEEFENIRIEERAQESSKRKGLSLPEDPKPTPNSTGVKGAGGKSVDQQYKDIIAKSKDPKATEEAISQALSDTLDFEKKTYERYLESQKNGTVPKGYEKHYQDHIDQYKPVIEAEQFLKERRKKALDGDFETEAEVRPYLFKMMDKYKKDYDYYDSPEYAEKREKFKSIVGEAPLPPVLSGKIPAKDLRQTLKPGDKLLRKQATYGYAGGSSGNTPTGWKYSDGGEVVKAAIKNVSTKINYGMGDRMFDNSVPMRDVTHVIRDGKRYKVDDSDSSPNDLGIPESVKPKAKKRVKKNDFNSHLNITEFGSNNLRRRKSKLANFAKPGCCCDASKPLKRRKTKQTPRLKRRGNKYA